MTSAASLSPLFRKFKKRNRIVFSRVNAFSVLYEREAIRKYTHIFISNLAEIYMFCRNKEYFFHMFVIPGHRIFVKNMLSIGNNAILHSH